MVPNMIGPQSSGSALRLFKKKLHNEQCQEVSRNVQVYTEVELVGGKIIVIMTVTNINVKGVKDTIR